MAQRGKKPAAKLPVLHKAKPRGKPFQKGQSGNPQGRPMYSRQKLSEAFIQALGEDFEEHGVDAIRRMRRMKPDAYVRVVADILPKNLKLGGGDGEAFVNLWKRIGGGGGEAA